MPLDPDAVLKLSFPEGVQTYTQDDTIRYALSIGLGQDPMDAVQLKYVYEKDLRAFPTQAVVLGCTPPWTLRPETGVTRTKVVHGEQSLVIHAPLPVAATVRTRERVTAVYDKGAERGAVVVTERTVHDAGSAVLLATLRSTIFCRADGGFGGVSGPGGAERALPQGAPHATIDLPTVPQQALMYRLNYDRNPLHADPDVARAAGFPRPILHGLCTWGLAAQGLVRAVLGGDASRLLSFDVRFSQPVLPGETVTLEIWREGPQVQFRGLVQARGVKVLDRGHAQVAE